MSAGGTEIHAARRFQAVYSIIFWYRPVITIQFTINVLHYLFLFLEVKTVDIKVTIYNDMLGILYIIIIVIVL